MRRRDFLHYGVKSLVTGAVALSARVVLADGGCTWVSPYVQRCDVGIPFQAATQKAKQQHMSEWCWAASISMAFAYHGYEVTQERIVSEAWGEVLNIPGSPEAILKSVNRPWEADDGRKFISRGDPYTVNIQTVVQDLQNNDPVLIGTMGHMMVLTVIFQQVVHSRKTREADCDEQSVQLWRPEWTFIRMHDLPLFVECS
jgi:hypothetical protein